MPLPAKGKLIGQSFHLDSTTAVTNAAVAAGATPTKAEYDALVGKFNALIAELKSQGLIKA